ncbi:MAG: Zn-ribbon domain-containing OB-fold protein [Candidatus Methylomirabilia bacterium]
MITLKAFFEEARAGRLTGIRCQGCGKLAVPPKESCAACSRRAWEVVPLEGHGTIESFTIHAAPLRALTAGAPYAVAVVRLDEGLTMLGQLVDIPLESLRTGLPVRFRPLIQEDQTVVGFGPA